MSSALIPSIIRAYDDPVVRAYCWGRFWILRQRFLDEIGQYLPAQGRVLDLGCGFGLFSLYYAATRPGLADRGVRSEPPADRHGPRGRPTPRSTPMSATRSAT